MIYDEVWEALKQLDENAYFNPEGLISHDKHRPRLNARNSQEYNEITNEITSSPATYIQGDLGETVQGYITQGGIRVKFKQYGDSYIIGAYSGDAVTGTAITCYIKKLKNILQDADPYRFYRKSNKNDDYRYRCDLDGKFRGLKYFNGHPELHEDTSEDRIKEIKKKLYKREKLGRFNTDKE